MALFGKWFSRRKPKPATVVKIPSDSFKIPRYAFFWLLASVIGVLLPHLGRMPVWLTAVCFLCITGRVLIYQGRLSYPGSKLKGLIVLGMAAAAIAQYGRDVISTDATVGILLVGISLKLLEMHLRRDILMVIYLCYFTVVAEFIYSQAIVVAIYMTVVVLMITCTLMALHQSQTNPSFKRTLKLSAAILLQSGPLMLAFFLLFPRISPLWSVPMQSNNGLTGLSENMAPGDIGNLIRSAEVAFRVQFKSDPPAYNELYWRAITLDQFDGKQWRRGLNELPQRLNAAPETTLGWFEEIQYLGNPVEYNVILEPTYQNWIYTLQMPQILDERMLMRHDYQVDSRRRITQRFNYDVISYLSYGVETGADSRAMVQRLNRRIPPEGNPQARAFAESLRASVDSDQAYISAVLNYFREESFYYTTSPELLGDNPVDDFLFSTREGFCEHFSSSFTYLMRAANIPARVVTGYMGGEFNPYDDTLTVRQYDAHAWSEVWLEGAGWIRVDPTAAVAPERINQGSDQTLQEQDNFMENEVFSLMRFRNSLLLNDLRLRLEMMDYAWNRFVLNYDQDMQFRLFNSVFGSVTKAKILTVVIGFMVVMTGIIIFFVFRSSTVSKKLPATQCYLKFCRYLASLGLPRETGETPWHYAQRLAQSKPQWQEQVQDITRLYMDLVYTQSEVQAPQVQELAAKIRKFRVLN